MTTFPKYTRYKDSGVEWLGEVPETWEVEKARYIFKKEERPPSTEDGVVTAYRDGQVTLRSLRRAEGYTMAIIEHGYQSVQEGDLVIHGMDAFAGAIGVSEANGKCTPEYSVLTPKRKGINPHWYAHLFRLMAHRGYIHIICPSVRERAPRFRFPKLQDNFLPIPPKPEQDRIVTFLDRKTAEIDALIAKKQRQIQLLDEQKAIRINLAVTRGIVNREFGIRNEHLSDSNRSTFTTHNSKFKPSGVPWIGDVPEGWEMKKLKYLISIQAGYAFKSSAYSQNESDIRLLRGINVNPGQINWNDSVYWPKDRTRGVEEFALDADDMVMGMDRPWVFAGVRIARIQKSDLPALLLQRVARIRAVDIEPDFLERTLTGSGFKAYFEPILTGVSVPHISPDQIATHVAAVPPRDEQIEICKFINAAETLRDRTVKFEEAQIQSLKTLRSTLIAHAVTGRIKV